MVALSPGACEPGKHDPGVVGGFGRIRGQLKIAEAVCIDPSLLVASAVIVAPPLP
jgi:hypothetical protein